jgi:hypothetical protein
VILFIGLVILLAFGAVWVVSLGSFAVKSAGRKVNPILGLFAQLAIPLTAVVFLAVLIYITLIPR